MKKTFITALVLALVGATFLVHGVGATEEEHGGTIVFTRPVKAVVFDHQSHMDMGYECDTCHDGLFEYATGSAEESGEFNHKSFAEGNYCGACHDGSTAFTAVLDKATGKCTLCHIGVKGLDRASGKETKKPHGD